MACTSCTKTSNSEFMPSQYLSLEIKEIDIDGFEYANNGWFLSNIRIKK